MLQEDPRDFYIYASSGEFGAAYELNGNLYVNPNFQPLINTDVGDERASTTRLLAHELGQLAGTKDSGPGNMDNVNKWENPIMSKIEGYNRTTYRYQGPVERWLRSLW